MSEQGSHDGGGGWTDVPPERSPRIIPGPDVDEAALRRRLEAQGREAAELRAAAGDFRPGCAAAVVSVQSVRGQVRYTRPDGSTWTEVWVKSGSRWRPAAV